VTEFNTPTAASETPTLVLGLGLVGIGQTRVPALHLADVIAAGANGSHYSMASTQAGGAIRSPAVRDALWRAVGQNEDLFWRMMGSPNCPPGDPHAPGQESVTVRVLLNVAAGTDAADVTVLAPGALEVAHLAGTVYRALLARLMANPRVRRISGRDKQALAALSEEQRAVAVGYASLQELARWRFAPPAPA
jgi:hypothetical protein